MDNPTIKINMDAPCSRCGESGATDSGLCLTCITRRLESPMRTKRDNEQLRVRLTAEEKARHAEQLAELSSKLADAESEKKFQADRIKMKIEDVKQSVADLCDEVRHGALRDVEVETIWYATTGTVETIRLDTAEVIRLRPMTMEERQMPLPVAMQ